MKKSLSDSNIIELRKKNAITAIKKAYGTKDDEFGITLFVSHHLDEIDSKYWKTYTGKDRPSPQNILDILELKEHWSEEDKRGIDFFDFTLPQDITDYMICVSFDEKGDVVEISMES